MKMSTYVNEKLKKFNNDIKDKKTCGFQLDLRSRMPHVRYYFI